MKETFCSARLPSLLGGTNEIVVDVSAGEHLYYLVAAVQFYARHFAVGI